MIKVSFITLLSYDYKYVYDCISSYYQVADEIILGLDENRKSWSKKSFEIDMEEVKAELGKIDVDNKIKIIEGDFSKLDHPMKNDTYERNYLSQHCKDGNWIISIDSDERLSNPEELLIWLETADPECEVLGTWDGVFKQFENDNILIDNDETAVIGTKIKNIFRSARETGLKKVMSPARILHYSWGRTEDELWQKLNNWSHAGDFDVEKFFNMWKSITLDNYHTFKNIHPLDGVSWSALRLAKKKNNDILSIVIPKLTFTQKTRMCLRGISEIGIKHEIILVKEGSDTVDVEYFTKENNSSKIICIESDEELTYSKACNAGASFSSGSVICFLDEDSFVDFGFKEAFTKMSEDEDMGVMGVKTINLDGKIENIGLSVSSKDTKDQTFDFPHRGIGSKVYISNYKREFQSVSRPCIFVRKDSFSKLKFCENYNSIYAEADLCARMIHELDKKVMYFPYVNVTNTGSLEKYIEDPKEKEEFLSKWADKLSEDKIKWTESDLLQITDYTRLR